MEQFKWKDTKQNNSEICWAQRQQQQQKMMIISKLKQKRLENYLTTSAPDDLNRKMIMNRVLTQITFSKFIFLCVECDIDFEKLFLKKIVENAIVFAPKISTD